MTRTIQARLAKSIRESEILLSDGRTARLIRLVLLLAAFTSSACIWKVNYTIPAENRMIWGRANDVFQHTWIVQRFLKDLKKYAQTRPRFAEVLRRHHIDKLLAVGTAKSSDVD